MSIIADFNLPYLAFVDQDNIIRAQDQASRADAKLHLSAEDKIDPRVGKSVLLLLMYRSNGTEDIPLIRKIPQAMFRQLLHLLTKNAIDDLILQIFNLIIKNHSIFCFLCPKSSI